MILIVHRRLNTLTTHIRVTVHTPGLCNLSNCDQTAHCFLGILESTVQMTDLCWERRGESITREREFCDRRDERGGEFGYHA